MPNKQSVYNYIEKLKEILARLLTFRNYALDDFEKKEELQWALDRGIQLAVQCSIDIGEEIITGLNLRKPLAYKETFDILAEHGIISGTLSEKLKAFVQYRNELVHEYFRIDVQRNYQILREELNYFEEYLKAIGKVLT